MRSKPRGKTRRIHASYLVFALPSGVGTSTGQHRTGPHVAAARLTPESRVSRLHHVWSQAESERLVTISGRLRASNDGSNVPWWDWSIADLSVPEQHAAEAGDLVSVLGGDSGQISEHDFTARIVPLAVLDHDGRVQHGEFRLGEVGLEGIASGRKDWMQPRNEFQRLVWCTFYRDAATTDAFADLKGRFVSRLPKDPARYPAYVCFAPRRHEQRLFTFASIGIGSLGLARGPSRNPHYRHLVELRSDAFNVMLYVQHTLPELVGREILFRHNTGLVSNYQEPIGLWCGNTQMSWGRPVLEGILRINRMEVQAASGELASVDAEAVFKPDVVNGVPRSRERPPGYLRFCITPRTPVNRMGM
jgi:hypothetical protein